MKLSRTAISGPEKASEYGVGAIGFVVISFFALVSLLVFSCIRLRRRSATKAANGNLKASQASEHSHEVSQAKNSQAANATIEQVLQKQSRLSKEIQIGRKPVASRPVPKTRYHAKRVTNDGKHNAGQHGPLSSSENVFQRAAQMGTISRLAILGKLQPFTHFHVRAEPVKMNEAVSLEPTCVKAQKPERGEAKAAWNSRLAIRLRKGNVNAKSIELDCEKQPDKLICAPSFRQPDDSVWRSAVHSALLDSSTGSRRDYQRKRSSSAGATAIVSGNAPVPVNSVQDDAMKTDCIQLVDETNG